MKNAWVTFCHKINNQEINLYILKSIMLHTRNDTQNNKLRSQGIKDQWNSTGLEIWHGVRSLISRRGVRFVS